MSIKTGGGKSLCYQVYHSVQYMSVGTRQWLLLVLNRPSKLLILLSSAKYPVS